jgi:thiol-disulfide isomerase/thioredoxin
MESNLFQVANASDLHEILSDQNNRFTLTVIYYSASWCGPCKMIKPKFVELSKKYKSALFLLIDVDSFEDGIKINVGNTQQLIEYSNDVSSLPTFKFFVGTTQQNDLGFSGADYNRLLSDLNNGITRAQNIEKATLMSQKQIHQQQSYFDNTQLNNQFNGYGRFTN